MPEPNVGYYVHHHGAGHGVRAASIAQAMHVPATLIGSQLPQALPAGVRRLQLPGDTAQGMRVEHFDVLHYAPLAVDGVRERMAMLAQWFSKHWPCLLVVDVSVEIALFARLCAVPVIYVRQHGVRDDAAHRLAYESASALLAPYPAEMEAPDTPQWLRDKTTYSGWLSRFTSTPCATPQSGRVLIITGHGGTGLSAALIEAVARQCPERQFRVAGGLTPEDTASGCAIPNLQWLGHLSNPAQEMRCAEIVVGSASDSLVGEAASLGCRYIAVADDRPFDEQRLQARRLNTLSVAIGLEHGWPAVPLWPALFGAAQALDPGRWRGWANEAAAARAARFIEDTLMTTTQTLPLRTPGV
jgi:predicted glycosyltransferase